MIKMFLTCILIQLRLVSYRLPLLRQKKHYECGVACLVMMACYYGNFVGLRRARKFLQAQANGLSVREIIECSCKFKLVANVRELTVDQLSQLKTPSVLHWNKNHFVILKSISDREAVIHDPAAGIVRIVNQDLQNYYSGIVIDFEPINSFECEYKKLAFKKTQKSASLFSRQYPNIPT